MVSEHMHILNVMYVMKCETRIHDETAGCVSSVLRAKLCANLLELYSHISAVTLQSKLLKKATSMLAAEKEQNKRERDEALNERVPPLKLSGLSAQELQVFS